MAHEESRFGNYRKELTWQGRDRDIIVRRKRRKRQGGQTHNEWMHARCKGGQMKQGRQDRRGEERRGEDRRGQDRRGGEGRGAGSYGVNPSTNPVHSNTVQGGKGKESLICQVLSPSVVAVAVAFAFSIPFLTLTSLLLLRLQRFEENEINVRPRPSIRIQYAVIAGRRLANPILCSPQPIDHPPRGCHHTCDRI